MAPGPAANSKRVLYLLITDLDSDTVKMSKWNFANVEDKPPNFILGKCGICIAFDWIIWYKGKICRIFSY